MLHEPLDRPALAGGVAALEQDHDPLAGLLHPGLQLQQLHLQVVLLALVGLARHQVPVRVDPGLPRIDELVVGARGGRSRRRGSSCSRITRRRRDSSSGEVPSRTAFSHSATVERILRLRLVQHLADGGGPLLGRLLDGFVDQVLLERSGGEVRHDIAVCGLAAVRCHSWLPPCRRSLAHPRGRGRPVPILPAAPAGSGRCDRHRRTTRCSAPYAGRHPVQRPGGIGVIEVSRRIPSWV